jgi:hypothetical protein
MFQALEVSQLQTWVFLMTLSQCATHSCNLIQNPSKNDPNGRGLKQTDRQVLTK